MLFHPFRILVTLGPGKEGVQPDGLMPSEQAGHSWRPRPGSGPATTELSPDFRTFSRHSLTTVHFAITFGALPAALAAWTRQCKTSNRRSVLALWLYVVSAPATALSFALRAQPMIPGLVEVICAAFFAIGFAIRWLTIKPLRPRLLGIPLLIGFLLGAGYTLTQFANLP